MSFSELTTDDEQLIRQSLEGLARIPLDGAVSKQAVVLRRRFRLRVPDAIVAASALVLDAGLVTNDRQLLGLNGLRTRGLRMREAE